jgi:hypothetical protein
MCLLTEAIYDAEYAPAVSVLTVAVYDTAVCVIFFIFTDLKNIILTYTKDFSWKKKDPNSPDFLRKKIINRQIFYNKFQYVAKNYKRIMVFSTFISSM